MDEVQARATAGASVSPVDSEPDFSQQQRVWEEWAQADPLWAILSEPSFKGGNWDIEEFFRSGEHNIQLVMDDLAQREMTPAMGRCLDFGCGVGRLTQALADRFQRSDGVDISATMVDLARQYNKHGDRCQYHVNTAPDLAVFDSNSFDFIYSTIVLQHNPPQNAERYIQEFGRLLAPGGVAVFDMTTGLNVTKLPDGSHRAEVSLRSTVGPLRAGESAVVEVTVTNRSGIDWPAGSWLGVGNHWQAKDPRHSIEDDGRVPLPEGLAAGASLVVQLTVSAPQRPGTYALRVDLVEEAVTWFADRGSQIATTHVTVTRGERRLFQRRRPHDAPKPATHEPELFTMNGLPRERVENAMTSAGCTVVDAVPSSNGGIHWEGYQYFVVKHPLSGNMT